MQITTVKGQHTSLKEMTCPLCTRRFRVGERALYKQSAGYGYRGYAMHLRCLAKYLQDEEEFIDKDTARQQFEEYRAMLVERYNK